MTATADRRADLDLQVNLLAEHEITRLIHLVDDIARQVGARRGSDESLDALKRDVKPEVVIEEVAAPRRSSIGESEVKSGASIAGIHD